MFIGGLNDGTMVLEHLLSDNCVEAVEAFVLSEDAGPSVSDYKAFDDLVSAPNLTRIAQISDHINGSATRIEQNSDEGLYTRKRRPEVGEINWNRQTHEIN